MTLLPVSSGIHDNPVYDLDGNKAALSQLPHDPAFQAALLRWAMPALHTSVAELPDALAGLTAGHRASQDVYGTFISDMLSVVDTPGKPVDGALTRPQVWQMFLAWSEDDKQRMAYRQNARLYAAIRARLPLGAEAVTGGTRYFPNLRVRS